MSTTASPAPSVPGYTKPTAEALELVTENKMLEEFVCRQVDRHLEMPGNDPRLVAIARTHFMEGFMALNRAVFQPERLYGDKFKSTVLQELLEQVSTR